MKNSVRYSVLTVALSVYLDSAMAVEFEKLGSAVANALKTKNAFKATTQVDGENTMVFYSKGSNGRANRYAVVQKGIYKPTCTHTWVIGINENAAVSEVRVVEMSCTHAHPTRKASFLAQFKGKTLGATRELASTLQVVAKATGSSELTRDAVVKSLKAVNNLRGRI